ncbi:9583_t:CDS:2 [Acaulospora morrowiae]|uniref:Mediator of RNA polymerase II transcription subunit 20 n=1 Tax=Acaulospora morrowiae TaxID=94023 RepID=A0A9N9A557_9GLOM|nr:9583_t:CDS:2 [Acaulospora morrowiae]
MGVTCVLLFKCGNGPLALQEFHSKMIEVFACRNPERWAIAAKLFFGTKTIAGGKMKMAYSILYNLSPTRIFLLSEDTIVEAEREMESILLKLKNLWTHRPTVNFEGNAYNVGDFIVRAANPLSANVSYKGMLVEVEYLPAVHPYVANSLLREFLTMIVPATMEVVQWEPNEENSYSKVGLSEEVFTRTHTSYQYMMLFKKENLLL